MTVHSFACEKQFLGKCFPRYAVWKRQ
uniref:Uncharacterized protein n=1 Tax=Anguilla anguilla TaxID=7936 RepID=A0A0E9RVZ9_ANGAN